MPQKKKGQGWHRESARHSSCRKGNPDREKEPQTWQEEQALENEVWRTLQHTNLPNHPETRLH